MQLHNVHDSFVPTTMVTIITNRPLTVLELYKNIAKYTLTCIIIDQTNVIVFKLILQHVSPKKSAKLKWLWIKFQSPVESIRIK